MSYRLPLEHWLSTLWLWLSTIEASTCMVMFSNIYSSAVSILSRVFLPVVYISLLYIAAASISCILTAHSDSIILLMLIPDS